jgi:DNA topoisomerase-1
MLTSDKNQKEAHEAIRPTNIHLRELPEKEGTIKQQKVYKMIWENTLESCMASADFYKITANITAPFDAKYALHTEIVDFMGWKIVKEQEEKIKKNDKTYNYLLSLTQTVQHIDPQKIICKEVMAESKLHYTEARLVQLLEEKGIGRPSTFSSLVEKIQEREYVKKTNILGKIVKCLDYELENGAIHELESSREFGGEKNKLLIQPLGIIVMQFLETHFDTIFQYEYTSSMENQLDDITRGNKFLLEICRNCLSEIDSLVEKTGPTLKKKEIKIDETHTFIIGKYGPVIKCLNTGSNDKITFQPAKKDLSLETLEKGEYSLEEITAVNGDNSDVILLGKYEETDLFLKKGRYGLYASWDKKTISLKTLGNRPCENIGLEEVIQVIETTERPISENIKIKRGKKGYYIFYKTKKNKKPEFYTLDGFAEKNNILSCDINLLKKWIKEKYNIV